MRRPESLTILLTVLVVGTALLWMGCKTESDEDQHHRMLADSIAKANCRGCGEGEREPVAVQWKWDTLRGEDLYRSDQDYMLPMARAFEKLPESQRSFTDDGKPLQYFFRRDLADPRTIHVDCTDPEGYHKVSFAWVLLEGDPLGRGEMTMLLVQELATSWGYDGTSSPKVFRISMYGLLDVTDAVLPELAEDQMQSEWEVAAADFATDLDAEYRYAGKQYEWWPIQRRLAVRCYTGGHWAESFEFPVAVYRWQDGEFQRSKYRFTHPELIRDTVIVKSYEGLKRAIRSNRLILIDAAELLIPNEYYSSEGTAFFSSEYYDAVSKVFWFVHDLELRGIREKPTHFWQKDYATDVFHFQTCGNIVLRNIKAGHGEEADWACSAGVILAHCTFGLNVEDCNLYGSGQYAIDALHCQGIAFRNCHVYDCSIQFGWFKYSHGIHIEQCLFEDATPAPQMEFEHCSDMSITQCVFDGRHMGTDVPVFQMIENKDTLRMEGGEVRNMRQPFLASDRSIHFAGTKMTGNQFRTTYAIDTLR